MLKILRDIILYHGIPLGLENDNFTGFLKVVTLTSKLLYQKTHLSDIKAQITLALFLATR